MIEREEIRKEVFAKETAVGNRCSHCGKQLSHVAIKQALDVYREYFSEEELARLEALPMVCDCEDTERDRQEAIAKQQQEEAKKRRERDRKLFDASEMPEAWWSRSLMESWPRDTLARDNAFHKGIELCEAVKSHTCPPFVVITGANDGETTLLASCLAMRLLRLYAIRLRFVNLTDMITELLDAAKSYRQSLGAVQETFTKPPVLFLNRFGGSMLEEKAIGQLYTVLCTRRDHERPTFIMTAFDPENLLTFFRNNETTGRAIMDMISNNCDTIDL